MNKITVPTTLDPRRLKGMNKLLNNQSDHWLVTPTFWCATNLLTFMLMLLMGTAYFLYFEASKLADF